MADITTTTIMAPPAVPPKNPRRLSKLQTKLTTPLRPRQQFSNLPDHVCDVWEHAATLFHGYEWQDSAETFLYLARVIDRDLESTLCLLNSGLIFARLGDYTTASQILDEAKHIDEVLALTLFIIAHVQFQLGDLEKAQSCFRVSLNTLKGPSQRFDNLGMGFTLRAAQIKDDLRIFYDVTSDATTTLSALPANVIFEAPPRLPGHNYHTRDSSIDDCSLPALSEGSSSPPPMSLRERVNSAEFEHSGVQLYDEPMDDFPTADFDGLKEPPDKIFDVHAPAIPPRKLMRLVSHENAAAERSVGRANSGRGPSLQAREARVQGDSVQELAGFIRDLPSQNRLQPRSGEAEYVDTQDLADYFRAGPHKVQSDELPARKKRKGSTHSSVYSQDLRADSVRSVELASGWDVVKARSGPPSPYRYRSGVGSALATQTSSPAVSPPANAENEQNPMDESHRGHAEALHTLLSDCASQVSWPLTDEVEGSLRNLSLHSRENSIRSQSMYSPKARSHLSVPDRTSSQLGRPSINEDSVPDGIRAVRPPFRALSKLSKRPPSLLSNSGKSVATKSAPKANVKSTFTFLNAFGRSS